MKFVVNSYKVFIDSNPSMHSDDFFFYDLKVPSLYLQMVLAELERYTVKIGYKAKI